MVAESTEILAPMRQLGCATACSGVAAAMSARVHCRNGPPLAVSMMRSIAAGCSKAKTWKMALCSLSTGRRLRAAAPRLRGHERTRRRPAPPCWRAPPSRRAAPPPASAPARRRRRSPPSPSRKAAPPLDHDRGRAGCRLDAAAGERRLEGAVLRVVGDHGELGMELPRLRRRAASALRWATSASTS